MTSLGVAAVLAGLVAAGDCASCHEEEAKAWRASRHAVAFDNALFQNDFARHRRAWCVGCHAPEADAIAVARGTKDPATASGVSCRTCHVASGGEADVVVSARPPTAKGEAAHRMRHDPALATPELCARCHQFDVVDPRNARLPAGGLAMQDTVEEWRASSFAARGVTCQTCHMPEGSHAFRGGHDAALVRKGVSARVVRTGDAALRLEIHTTGIGHRFPTGDVTRRLAFRVCADLSCETPLVGQSFLRRIERVGESFVLVRDETVPASTTPDGKSLLTRAIALPAPHPGPLFWRLDYVLDEKGDRRHRLADGVVPR